MFLECVLFFRPLLRLLRLWWPLWLPFNGSSPWYLPNRRVYSAIYYLSPSDLGERLKSIGQNFVPETIQFMYNVKSSQSGVVVREKLRKDIQDGLGYV